MGPCMCSAVGAAGVSIDGMSSSASFKYKKAKGRRFTLPGGAVARPRRLSGLAHLAVPGCSHERSVGLGSSASKRIPDCCASAPPQTRSVVRRQIGPTSWAQVWFSKKKRGRTLQLSCAVYAAPIFKKKRDKLLCLFHVAVTLPCVSGVVYLYFDIFFIIFSAVTACSHCVHIASFLHDFDRFSYSLSTASC
jgi:hypothetical protein